MKKNAFLIAALLLCAGLPAQNTIKLPAPKKDAGMTLYQALQQRASVRQFKTDAIPEQKLSDLLWAACGINREDGRLTAPTAINSQDIRLYVCRKEGAYEYIAKDNSLVKVSGKDLRQDVAAGQGTVGEAPLFIVLVADHNRYNLRIPGLPPMAPLTAAMCPRTSAWHARLSGFRQSPGQ